MNNKVISCKKFQKKVELTEVQPEQIDLLKQLGIKIGEQVMIHPLLLARLSGMNSGQDIKIGNNSKIGNCTLIGKIDIGQHCKIGDDAILENNVILQRKVTIEDNTSIAGPTTIHKELIIGKKSLIISANIHKNINPETERYGGETVNGGETTTTHPRRKNFIQEEQE